MRNERLSGLERETVIDESIGAKAKLLRERLSVGELKKQQIDVAALLGDGAAQLVLGNKDIEEPSAERTSYEEYLQHWLHRLEELAGRESLIRAVQVIAYDFVKRVNDFEGADEARELFNRASDFSDRWIQGDDKEREQVRQEIVGAPHFDAELSGASEDYFELGTSIDEKRGRALIALANLMNLTGRRPGRSLSESAAFHLADLAVSKVYEDHAMEEGYEQRTEQLRNEEILRMKEMISEGLLPWVLSEGALDGHIANQQMQEKGIAEVKAKVGVKEQEGKQEEKEQKKESAIEKVRKFLGI